MSMTTEWALTKEEMTLLAAVIAAVVSLMTLLLNILTARSAELRKVHRDVLTTHIHDLGDCLHQTVATSNILLKNKTDESIANWRDKAAAAKSKLKALRIKLRYPLWGLDSAFKTISLLPDWIDHVRLYPEHSAIVLDKGNALGQLLDRTVRRCYMRGRSPNWLEIQLVNWRRRQLEKAYESFKNRPK